ncbi:LysR family transcriptional regulator [Bacillus sp. 2205SS5-2]|uniref:LysR family transcriptional regulator n=1 Tax=Bacillus sp. 2205SS5-2 TaxID=3109031 RepID=UPI003004538E
MSLAKYEIFSKVAELKSFTKTAEVLGFTQSAVSHAITSLEREFSFPLFIRSHSKIKLTRDAEILLINIRKILYYNDMLHQEVDAINGLKKGRVRVGVFSSVSAAWIPDIIKVMGERFPHLLIELMEGNYDEIVEWLQYGEIDCGFLNNIDHLESFEVINLKKDRLLAVLSTESPLSNENQLSIQNLEKSPFIMPTYQCYKDILGIFNANQITPQIRFENMNESSVISMVANNLGISILPEMVIPKSVNSIQAIPLDPNAFRSISLAVRKPASPAANYFLEVTKERVAGLS